MFKHNIGVGLKPIASLFREKDVFHDCNTTYCESIYSVLIILHISDVMMEDNGR